MNKNIGVKKMVQVLDRCAETRSSTTVPLVVSTYDGVLAPKVTAFKSAVQAAKEAKTSLAVARIARVAAVRGFERLYLAVKAVIGLHVEGEELPGALSTQPTDTDTKLAIQAALDILNGHHGESWADAIVSGDFGTQAPDVIAKVTAAIEAAAQSYAAQVAARGAFDAVYPAYLGYKQVVRHMMGSSSPDYRRINVRGKTAAAEPTPGPTPETEAVAPAATNGTGTTVSH
jgi:hypothetical protein